MLKISNNKLVDVNNWDQLVTNTYGKPYAFQQQDGCQDRGIYNIDIPNEDENEDSEMNDNIPFEINGEIMGIKFKTWLKTTEEDINQKIPETYKGLNKLFWHRNFYPNIQTVANDLHKKGLIEKGNYSINIDW